MPVYIKKYSGNNYFQRRDFVDSLKLDYIPAEGLPVFRFETEDSAGIGTYRAGDFDLIISLLQTETSQSGNNIRKFFLGEQRDYYYLLILKIGNQSFSGIAQQSQIYADYTYTQNKFEIKLTCKDILIEWSKRCEIVPNSTINLGNSVQLTFEEYITRHFSGITSNVVLINLPGKSYLNRLKELYSNIQWCYALGDYRNFIVGQENISRWETFKELAKGLGFNFEMYLNSGTETTNEPEYIFNIFFLTDLENEIPLTLQIIEHKESITAPRLEWLYLKYRSLVFGNVDYSSGIFFNSINAYLSDTDNSINDLYPACVLNLRNKVLNYINDLQITEKTILRDIDFGELELKQYGYNFSSGRPIGKLHPIGGSQGADSGGMAYSRIFNCSRVHNGSGDNYDFIPIQENASLNYMRYIKGIQKRKEFKIILNVDISLKIWSTVNIEENHGNEIYYINSIREIDIRNKFIVIELLSL